MKEFNLEAAKRGEAIVCRDGTPVKFIAHVLGARKTESVVVLIGDEVVLFTESGKFYPDESIESFDLFMASKKRTVWVNFYDNNFATFFNTQEEADRDHQETQFDIDRLGNRAYPVEIEQ